MNYKLLTSLSNMDDERLRSLLSSDCSPNVLEVNHEFENEME